MESFAVIFLPPWKNNVKLALQLGADAFVVRLFQAECLIERIG